VHGPTKLDTDLTINGSTITGNTYIGTDATTSTWNANSGSAGNFAIAGSNTDPVVGVFGPFSDGTTGARAVAGANKYYSLTGGMQVGTNDFVIEWVSATATAAGVRTFSTNTGGGTYIEFFNDVAAKLQVNSGGTFEDFDATVGAQEINHYLYFHDASGSGRMYVNGTAADTEDVSAMGTLSGGGNLSLFDDAIGSGNSPDSCLYWFGWWDFGAGGLGASGHDQDTLAAERFYKLSGIWPHAAIGTKAPTVNTRGSIAYADCYLSSVRKMVAVGDNWMRVVTRNDGSSSLTGVLNERSSTNLIVQSNDLGTTWTELDAGDSLGTGIAAPAALELSNAMIADATDGSHGHSQAVTLTATTYVFSCFAKEGDQTHLYLSDDTVANATGYFNLNTGALGTIGAGATGYIEDWGEGWYRCAIAFTGTAASHTLKVQTAEGDTDITFAGDGSTINTHVFGVQCEARAYPTSYIATTTGTVTRSADVLYYKGDDGNVTNNQIGTVVSSFLLPNFNNTGDRTLWQINDGGSNNDKISGYVHDGTDAGRTSVAATGLSGGDAVIAGDVSDGTIHEHRSVWQTDNLTTYIDGTGGTADDDVGIPDDLDRIHIGDDRTAALETEGIVGNIKIYDKLKPAG